MNKTLFNFNGEGEFHFNFDDFRLKSKFNLILYLEGRAQMYVEIDFFSKEQTKIFQKFQTNEEVKSSLLGKLENGSNIKADELILESVGGLNKGKSTPLRFRLLSDIIVSAEPQKIVKEKSEIEFLLTNFIFSGTDRTLSPEGGSRLNRFSLNVDGFDFEFIQEPDYQSIKNDLQKKITPVLITSRVRIKTDLSNREDVFKIIDDLCYLISFATGTLVTPVTERQLNDGKLVKGVTRAFRTSDYKPGNQVIDDFDGNKIKKFIEVTYPNFKNYEEAFGLRVVIDYYLFLKSHPILDIRCLLGYILLECLTSNVADYYSKKGNSIKSNAVARSKEQIEKIVKEGNIPKELIEKIASEVAYKNYTLQEVIDYIRKEFSMKYHKGDVGLFGLRKEFIHKGIFPKGVTNHLEIYYGLVNFIDRLILHILGYNGLPYLNIKKGITKREELLD